jgi:hypothetical protein
MAEKETKLRFEGVVVKRKFYADSAALSRLCLATARTGKKFFRFAT